MIKRLSFGFWDAEASNNVRSRDSFKDQEIAKPET